MISRVFFHFIEDLIRWISGPIGVRLRRAYYRSRFKRCGTNLSIDAGVYFERPDMMSFGDWVWIDKNVVMIAGAALDAGDVKRVENPNCKASSGEIIVGDRCHIGVGCVVQGHGGVQIGDAFTASSGCRIYSLSNSPFSVKDGPVIGAGSQLDRVQTPVAIGANAWLGLNVAVVGSTIGDDCFVKPFSLVISNLPANTVASGNPASVERQRYTEA